MKFYESIDQRSDEWYRIRKWKMTASNAQAVWNRGKWLDTYVDEIVSEMYSSANPEQYTNKYIENGIDLESHARELYELETWNTVKEVCFVELDDYSGCSPDGLILDDGWLEIKCLKNSKHFEIICKWIEAVESQYIWQVQMNLYVTDRKWWDLVFFNPNYEESLVIIRIYRDEDKISQIKEWIEIWKKKIQEKINLYLNRKKWAK